MKKTFVRVMAAAALLALPAVAYAAVSAVSSGCPCGSSCPLGLR